MHDTRTGKKDLFFKNRTLSPRVHSPQPIICVYFLKRFLTPIDCRALRFHVPNSSCFDFCD